MENVATNFQQIFNEHMQISSSGNQNYIRLCWILAEQAKNILLKIYFTTLLLPKSNFKLGILEENSV